MKSLLILFFTLPVIFFGQNNPGKKDITGTSTYTVCNPDSSGTFQVLFNDVYLFYGLFKTYKCNYNYNSNNKHVNGFSQYCVMSPGDTVWTNSTKWVNSYNNNNLTDSITMDWIGSIWSDTVNLYHYGYDINQNLNSITHKVKNSNGWVNSLRTVFDYNISNNISSVVYQNWDITNTRWNSFDSVRYVYNNNLLTNRNYFRVISNPNNWSYYAYDTIQYNSLNLPTYLLKKIFSNNVWTNQKERVWSYDASNRITSVVYNVFLSISNYWENDYNSYYTYNSDGKQILQSAADYKYYSNCSTNSLIEINGFSKPFFISPNPTNTIISITSSFDYETIKIINSIGQTVLIQENKQEPISVSNLSNGIYFMQLLDKKWNLLKTEKFIKE